MPDSVKELCAMVAKPSAVTFRQVLKNERFFALWVAQLVSAFGDWIAIIALFSFVVFRLHGTPAHVSGVLIAYTIPVVFVGPLSGVLVDRSNLRRVMIISDILRALIIALLMLPVNIPQIYLLILLMSAISCFFLSAQNASIGACQHF